MKKNIKFGALAPKLRAQLREQKLRVKDADKLAHLQRDADAVSRLLIRGLITEGMAHLARKQIVDQLLALNPSLVDVVRGSEIVRFSGLTQ
jgi:hypothetical protein